MERRKVRRYRRIAFVRFHALSDSEELVNNSGLPLDSLIEVGTEHRLADDESLAKMLEVVEFRNSQNRK